MMAEVSALRRARRHRRLQMPERRARGVDIAEGSGPVRGSLFVETLTKAVCI